MPFQIKVLDTISCPRCNGKAELRIDEKDPVKNWVFVYIVCPICKLHKYSYSTTRKAIYLQARINKLKKNAPKSRMLDARISKLEDMKRRAESDFN